LRADAQVPGASYEAGQSVDFATIYVPAASLVETCRALRETPSLRFNVLLEVTAADYLPREPRFEVVYHLLSIPNRLRLRVKVRVRSNEIDGVVPTVQVSGPPPAGRTRSVGHVRHRVRRPHGFASLADAGGLGRPPARKDYPVQIRKPAQTYEPLEVTEDEFRANIERDRLKRAH
jgi:NADH-quinone oxidoreductase subunit C